MIYELAWLRLAMANIDYPVAKMLRTVILGRRARIARRITMDSAEPPLSYWNGEPKAHIAIGTELVDVFALACGCSISSPVGWRRTQPGNIPSSPAAASALDLDGDQRRDSTLRKRLPDDVSRRRDPGDPLTGRSQRASSLPLLSRPAGAPRPGSACSAASSSSRSAASVLAVL